jgi:hypothetical protein
VYRLTSTLLITTEKYYYGYRGTSVPLEEDKEYLSSSAAIRALVKQYGLKSFRKKFLGVYVNKEHAIAQEVKLHKKFDVKNNPCFFNQSNQTSTKFEFDNTGRKQSDLANKKRSEKLKNRPKHTEESKRRIGLAVKLRNRPSEEVEAVRQNRIALNKQQTVCPHCGKIVGIPGGYRWHFDHCLLNPDVSPSTLADRERLSQRAVERNKKNKEE